MQDFVYYTPTGVLRQDSDNKIGKVIKEYGYSRCYPLRREAEGRGAGR